MEYIKKTIEYPLYSSRTFQFYFQDMDIGVLDIETTGLSPKNSAFVLGGLVTPVKDGLQAEQFFSGTLDEEKASLEAFWKAASSKDVLITFNGQHFDLPFMKERSNGMIREFPFHLDLYLLVKNFSPVRKFLPNLKQKTIEDYMGLWQYRKDEISGKESVELYYRFLTEKSDELKDKILLHNHDDILQLYRLLKVIEKSDFHKGMFHMGFPVRSSVPDSPYMIVEHISIKSDQLRITGRQYRDPVEYQAYELNGTICQIRFSKSDMCFCIDLPLTTQSEITLLDLEAIGFDTGELEKYPACQEGFLILQRSGETNYMETNHFVKSFIERMTTQWITDR